MTKLKAAITSAQRDIRNLEQGLTNRPGCKVIREQMKVLGLTASSQPKSGDFPDSDSEDDRCAGGAQTHVDMQQDLPDTPPQAPGPSGAATTPPPDNPQSPPTDDPDQNPPSEQEVLAQMITQQLEEEQRKKEAVKSHQTAAARAATKATRKQKQNISTTPE